MRIKPEHKEAFEQGRILFLSPFAEKHRRVTAELAQQRNLFVAALADVIFIAHAAPGSRTEQFCRQILEWNKPIWTVDDPENHNLLAMGARPVTPENLLQEWRKTVNGDGPLWHRGYAEIDETPRSK